MSQTAAPNPAEWMRCWRCGKLFRQSLESCPACGAARRRFSAPRDASAGQVSPIGGVMVVFGLMLAVSFAYGVLTSFGLEHETRAADPRRELNVLVGVECIDTVLVLSMLLWVARPPSWPRLAPAAAPILWGGGLVVLAAVLGLNASYHQLLRAYLRVPPGADAIVDALGVTPLVVVAYCLQPAVIEELFFRYFVLDHLRGLMNLHAAVGVSSLMFGLAHIGAPLSIPVLILVGVAMGYARALSGRLALPMLLHFLHNATIVWLE